MRRHRVFVPGLLVLLVACHHAPPKTAAPPPPPAPPVVGPLPTAPAPPARRPAPTMAAAIGDPWVAFHAPDGSFSIEFPYGAPVTRHLEHGVIRRTDYSTYSGASCTFMVQVFENDPRYAAARAAEILRDYPNPEASGIVGSVVREAPVQLGPYTGREVRIEGTVSAAPGLVTKVARAFVTDGRLYVVSSTGGPGTPLSEATQRFLDSFRILQ
jgi:hypothetical protein